MTTDDSKTRSELIGELTRLRRRLADLEGATEGDGAQSGGESPLGGGALGEKTTSWYRVDADVRRAAAVEVADPRSLDAGLPRDDGKHSLREIMAAAPVIFWAVDGRGMLSLAEGKKVRALGLEPDRLVGRSMDEAFGRIPQVRNDTRRALRGKSLTAAIELDGAALAYSCWPFRDASGQIVGAVGIAIDPTEPGPGKAEVSPKGGLTEELLDGYERDRRLIAYEIHDGLVQQATGAQMYLEALLEAGQLPPGRARDQVELALALVRGAVVEGRRLIGGLRPPVLDELGVVAAIESLIRGQPPDGPSITLIADVQFGRLEPLLETAIYRIAQEAITNVGRHSKSDWAEVRLCQVNDRVQIEIRDWGIGFDPARVAGKRLGLQGIRERARLLRGRAEIDSAPGEGARVFVDLPLAYPEGETVIMNDRSIE